MKTENTLNIENSGSVLISNIYKCPVCDWETNSEGFVFSFNDPEVDGNYCLKCWAKKTSKDLPKLEKIKNTE